MDLALGFRVTTDTVLAAELLAMSDAELNERLLAEGARNPALIVECAEVRPAAPPLREPAPPLREPALHTAAAGAPRPEPAASEHPAIGLVADAAPTLPTEDRALALAIAFGLDRRGFLTDTPEELARVHRVAPERVRRAIDAMRAAGPPGIATGGPRECLIAQLRGLHPVPDWRDLAIRLLESALEDVARRAFDRAARSLGVSRADVDAAVAGMRRHVRPYPEWDPPGDDVRPLKPDVVVDLIDDRLVVRLAQDDGLTVRVDERLRCDDPRLARAARDAEAWAKRVERRRSSLLCVAEATVALQEPALRDGLAHLRPLTRREVAYATGLPESTVSRVVSDRVLRTPSGRLLPFATLFGVALDAQAVLAGLIARGGAPRSDRALAEAMAAAGHPVARRTVAKYRQRLGIAPLAVRG